MLLESHEEGINSLRNDWILSSIDGSPRTILLVIRRWQQLLPIEAVDYR